MKNNTAEKQLEHQDQMDLMTKINHQAFANTVWDDPQKAITIHEFWKTFSHGKSDEIKHIAQLEMRRCEAIIQKMTDINQGFYGANATAYVDTVGVETELVDDKGIEEVLPTKESDDKSEAVVDAETNVAEEEESGKTVSLFNGEDMGDKPNQVDVSKSAKKLLADGREEDAVALAKQYLGTGNYTPKKPGAKAQEWKDAAIESWIKSLKQGLSKTTPKEEEETSQPEVETSTADETFGATRGTLEAEQHALKDFAERYIRLATSGSEDAVAAENLAELFFKGREYNDAQIKVWKETVTKNDDSSVLDHFAVLGAIGTDDGQLVISDLTYEAINTKVYDLMQELQVAKPQLKDTQSLTDYMVEEISRKLYEELAHTCFTSESGATYEMYTKLHYVDFIERVVVANFTKLDSPATTNEEDGQATGEASSSEEADTGGVKESTIEEEQAKAMETAKKKSRTGTTIKEVTLASIRNGGTIDDIADNPNYDGFFGEGHKYTKRESLEKHVQESFDTWRDEYLNSLTQYPMDEFQRAIDTGYFTEVPLEETTEEAKSFMVKPNGDVLSLFDKDNKIETRFPSVKDLEDYILRIYKNNKNAESSKEAQGEMQKDTSSDGSESDEPKEEEADTGSGEATESTAKASSSLVVKVSHIENIVNKAIKKGKDLSFILKDRKISELVEKGGAIIGPAKDARTEYDISAESLDQLRTDLQTLFDNVVEKKKNPVAKPSVLDKVKQITASTKGEESKEEEADEEIAQTPEPDETETSSIQSLNDVKPAGLVLIEQGGSKKDLLQWGQDNLLNRQMKEQEENAIFKTADAVDTFMKGMFSDFFKEETTEVIEDEKTVDDLETFITTASKEENATYVRVCKAANSYATENALEIKTGSILKLVREVVPELHQAHLDKSNAIREESKDKVFVPEKISETAPTVWDKVKDFKTLGEIYTTALELCDAGDWQQALNITTELIKGGTIETTEEWTDDMITEWFDKNVLKKEVAESTEATTEVVEDLDDSFKALQAANGGKSFRNVLVQIMSDNDDTPELRNKIETTVRGSKSNYARKMAKAKSSVIQSKINAAKLLAK